MERGSSIMSQAKTEASVPPLPSHYVGIGASAGMMLELLTKHTSMEIINVVHGVLVKQNAIYLIPPKKNMVLAQGKLLLSDKDPDSGLSLPIDIFFRSLSEDQKHKAIGIILSGTGSDGSRGIKALKEAGGLAIAQDPDTAKFDGMPNSAINTGVIDLILSPKDMGAQLESYISHPLVRGKNRY